MPVWIARRAGMVGIDSGRASVKRRLCPASASRLGGLYPVVAVGPDVVLAEAVDHDEDDVHVRTSYPDSARQVARPVQLRAEHGKAGQPHGPGAAELYEVPAREPSSGSLCCSRFPNPIVLHEQVQARRRVSQSRQVWSAPGPS